MDRTQAAQALGKVFAYLACGKTHDAQLWARKLIVWLEGI